MNKEVIYLKSFDYPVSFNVEEMVTYFNSLNLSIEVIDIVKLFWGGVRRLFLQKKQNIEIKYLFEGQVDTKFKQMKPLYELIISNQKGVLFLDVANVRFKKLYNDLKNTENVLLAQNEFDFSVCLHLFRSTFSIFGLLLTFNKKFILKVLFIYLSLLFECARYKSIISKTNCKYLITANEDSWASSALSELCKKMGVKNINIMHGRAYRNSQFYDVSLVFTETQASWLRQNTKSTTRFIPIGSVDVVNLQPFISSSNFRKLLIFEQPASPVFPSKQRDSFFETVKMFSVENPDVEILIRLHPSLKSKNEFTEKSWCKIIDSDLPLKDSIKGIRFALNVCSTAGLEAIALGVPVLFYNPDNLLNEFNQISFLEQTSITSDIELKDVMERFLSDFKSLERYYENQIKLVRDEYFLANSYKDVFKKEFT